MSKVLNRKKLATEFRFFLKRWGVDTVQRIIIVLSVIGTSYVEGIPKDYFRAFVVDAGLLAFFASAKILRRKRPRSKIVLEYARRAYRLAQWIFPVAAASIAPSV